MSPRLDDLLNDASPIGDDDVRELPLEQAEAQLLASIMDEPRASRAPRRPVWRLPRLWPVAVAALLLGLVVAGVSLIGGGVGAGPDRAWAASALRVANAVPRLLIGEPGWQVRRADQFDVSFGEMTFANGDRHFDLKWNAARAGAAIAEDRTKDPSLRLLTTTAVAGHRARVYRYVETADDFVAVWRQGGYVFDFRAGPGPAPAAARARTLAQFVALLHALRPASVDEWLSAMPASVVLPVDRDEVVRKMLADIPVPPEFDAGPLASGDAVRDRYQLGARVAGAAACAWIERWVRARSDGDRGAAARAIAAMQTSRDWAILRELQPQGHYSRVLWQYADAIAGSGTVVGGKVLTVEESYSDALGCRG